MRSGVSWSGSERNRAWANLGDGTFAEVSAIAGFDQVEDGRVVVRSDWDGDGDADLWLRSRNGPALRFLENTSTASEALHIEIEHGVRLNSVAATITDAGGRQRRRAFTAGSSTDGYLASSRDSFIVALRPGDVVTGLEYQMGNGGGSMSSSGSLGLRFRLTRNGGFESLPPKAPRSISLSAGSLPAAALPTRVVLRSPLPLPKERAARILGNDPSAAADGRLVVATSSTCETCDALVPAFEESLDGSKISQPHIVIMEAQGAEADGDFLHAIAAALLGPGAELALPLSGLLDEDGSLQVLYLGALDARTVAEDVEHFVRGPLPGAERTGVGTPGSGARWFHGAPRSLEAVAQELRRAGLEADATAYSPKAR